ncbi:MAG: hypothetical protein ACLQPD_14440 [Desulfomonilaceae bacterium]
MSILSGGQSGGKSGKSLWNTYIGSIWGLVIDEEKFFLGLKKDQCSYRMYAQRRLYTAMQNGTT